MTLQKTISVIFGTRPEAIKLAPVILELRRHPEIACRVCVTGQHRELLHEVLEVFDITPDRDLDLMEEGQTLAGFTSKALAAVDGYLSAEQPDLVLIQGDTSTVFATALASFYRGIPVGHVEAGLRSGDLSAPWPEEANRLLTSRLTALHFAPTEGASQHLVKEGVDRDVVTVTGNTVVDAILWAARKAREERPPIPEIPESLLQPSGDSRIVLVTGHRRESFGAGIAALCEAVEDLANQYPSVHFIYPVHPNPNVAGPVHERLGTNSRSNVHLVAPIPYLGFVRLMIASTLILTDSGGIQEEAPSLGKPVLVLRDKTERPEGLQAGTARLVGTDPKRIVAEVSRLLKDREAHEAMAGVPNPYGDGKAAERIVAGCLGYLAGAGARGG